LSAVDVTARLIDYDVAPLRHYAALARRLRCRFTPRLVRFSQPPLMPRLLMFSPLLLRHDASCVGYDMPRSASLLIYAMPAAAFADAMRHAMPPFDVASAAMLPLRDAAP